VVLKPSARNKGTGLLGGVDEGELIGAPSGSGWAEARAILGA
jgi:hypothetical protein